MNKKILLVGVGGQGTILTSKILSEGLIQQGYDVKMSEIHGMAQRGGSVTTQITFGQKVYSPNIGTAEADVLVAFEKAEAIRYLSSLKPEGTLIVNDFEIYSLPVLTGAAEYPSNINDELKAKVKHIIMLTSNKIAADLGNQRAQNIVLLGVIIKSLGLEKLDWVSVIKQYIPEKLQDLNIKAFNKGLEV
jgi:indolepyruvate ferredoxin oxidoreductase beta subunit